MIADDALLLRRIAWRESSFVVHLLTREHGRLALVARGARRPRSPLRGRIEPLHRLRIAWRPGRVGMGTLVDCVRGEALAPPARWPVALELLALAARLFPDGTPHGYAETAQALRALAEADEATAGLAGAWRLVVAAGLAGAPDACWRCGARDRLALGGDGLRCAGCGGGTPWPAEAVDALGGRSASAGARAAAGRLIALALRAHGVNIVNIGDRWQEDGGCIWA